MRKWNTKACGYPATQFSEVHMKIYRVKSKSSSAKPKPQMEEPEEEAMEEETEESGSPSDLLRQAADACDEGDYDTVQELISEALGMLGGEED